MQFVNIRYKELRKRLGLTQEQIAQKLGITQSAWARMENGGVPDIRVSTLFHICKTLNVSADWLLGLSEKSEIH